MILFMTPFLCAQFWKFTVINGIILVKLPLDSLNNEDRCLTKWAVFLVTRNSSVCCWEVIGS